MNKLILPMELLLELYKLPVTQRAQAIKNYLSTGQAIVNLPTKSNN